MRYKNKYFIWFIYFLLLFVITEIVSRIILSKFCKEDSPKVDCSNCWRILWVNNYSKKEKGEFSQKKLDEAVPYYIYDKTKGWNLKPGLKQYICQGSTIITTNSKGIRAQDEYPYERNPAKKRIIIIGDSFAMGALNGDKEIFSFFLGQMLSNVEVLNLGVGGYGHDQMLLKLKEEGIKYNPDMVILLYLQLDNHRNILSFRDYAKPRYILKNNKLILNNSPIDTPEEIIKKEKFQSYFWDLLNIMVYKIKEKLGLIQKEEEELAIALIKEMENTCSNINAKFLVVSLGGGINDKFIFGKLKKEEAIFLDISDAPTGAFENHWSPSGHRLVAEKLFKALLKNKFIVPEEIGLLGSGSS